MQTERVGRNDPCPCGSGRKYKHCCLLEVMRRQVQQRNQSSLDDFAGLAPQQMHALLYAPFDSPDVVDFASVLPAAPEATISFLFERLCQWLDAGKLKATAKGNLPRAFCRDAWEACSGQLPLGIDQPFGKVNREEDFHALHVTRIVAQEAGLLRKYKGCFILGKKCRKLRDEAGSRSVYPHLFQAGARCFNWAYSDDYPDLHIIQQGFAFSLYLLSRYGDTPRSAQFYAGAFLRAFPMMADEAGSDEWRSGEDKARHCYGLRTLQRFAGFMGLVTITAEDGDRISNEYTVTKTPLLDELVRFHVASPRSG